MEMREPNAKYLVSSTRKQTEAGSIPHDWTACEVAHAFEICNQRRMPLSRATRSGMSGPYPYYGPTGPQDWINEFRFDGEYALIGEDGDHFLKWRTQSMTLFVRGRFNVNNHAHVLRAIADNYTDWFRWFFANRDITQYLTRQGASRYKLTKATLARLPCALPSPKEQRAISDSLTVADALIDSLEQLLTKKRQIKQGAMQELLTCKRRLLGFADDWEEQPLGDFVKIEKGNLITAATARPGEVPVIGGGKSSQYTHVVGNRQGPTITVSASGASAGYVSLHEGPIFASDCSTIEDGPGYSLRFIYYALVHKQELIYLAQTGGAQPHVQPRDLEPLLIDVPTTEDEQTAIAQILSDMDTEITTLESRLTKARALKQAMAQALLTGRIRLVEPTA